MNNNFNDNLDSRKAIRKLKDFVCVCVCAHIMDVLGRQYFNSYVLELKMLACE